MSEALLAAWLGVTGVLALSPTSRFVPPWGAMFLAPIAASAFFVFSGLFLVSLGVFSTAITMLIVSFVALAAALVAVSKKVVTGRWFVRATGAAAGTALVVAIFAWQVPMVRLTADSFHYLMSALSLESLGTLTGIKDELILKRRLATPLLHTFGVLTGRGYVSFWSPLLGIATFGSLTWIAIEGLKSMRIPWKWQWAILVPSLVFVLTTNRVVYNFFYVNGHMLFAGFLLGGVGLGWLAVRTKSWALLVPSSLMFGALIPLRAEAAIVSAAFLVVFLSSRHIPLMWRWILLGPTVASTLVWDAWSIPRLVSDPSIDVLASPIGDVAIVAGLGLLVAAGGVPWLDRAVRLAPWIMIGLLVLVLGVLVAKDPQPLMESLPAMITAAMATGYWGTLWWIAPLLLIAAAVIGFPSKQYILIGILMYPLIIPILAYLRGSPYHSGSGDSANRMWMHIVPLVILAIVFAAGTAVRSIASPPGDGLKSLERDAIPGEVTSQA